MTPEGWLELLKERSCCPLNERTNRIEIGRKMLNWRHT